MVVRRTKTNSVCWGEPTVILFRANSDSVSWFGPTLILYALRIAYFPASFCLINFLLLLLLMKNCCNTIKINGQGWNRCSPRFIQKLVTFWPSSAPLHGANFAFNGPHMMVQKMQHCLKVGSLINICYNYYTLTCKIKCNKIVPVP